MSYPSRVLAARIAAHTRWGNEPDRAAATAPARKAFADRFVREVKAEHPDLDEATVRKLAESRRRAHMTAIARLSRGRKARRPAVA